MAGENPWDQPPLEVVDPVMLRAFAHPVRQRILRELSVRTHARATDLAQWLDQPVNALSFHLRTLAKTGLIRELPEMARDKRDRVWELANKSGYAFENPQESALSSFVSERFEWLRRLAAGELEDDRAVSTVQFDGALLTKAEAKQLAEEVAEVLAKWRKRGAESAERDPDDAERIHHAVAFALGRDVSSDTSSGRS